jgi:cell division septation protein DedD
MQSLVDSVRSTGATNVIMVPGVQYSNTLTHWLQYMPTDPLKSVAASWHSYAGQVCSSQTCWDANIAPVTAAVPLVTGEIGENDCAHGYVDTLMSWLDAHSSSYLAWGWDTYDCSSFPSLISAYDGTPTSFGTGVMNHLQQLAAQSTTPTSSSSQLATETPTATQTSTPVATATSTPVATAAATPTATATPPTSTATATPCPSTGNSKKPRCR